MIIKLKAPPRSPATGFLICAALDAAPKPPPSAIKVLDPSRSAENRAAAQGLQPLVIQSLKSSIWSLGKYGPPAGIWPNPAGLFGSHNVPGVPRSARAGAGRDTPLELLQRVVRLDDDIRLEEYGGRVCRVGRRDRRNVERLSLDRDQLVVRPGRVRYLLRRVVCGDRLMRGRVDRNDIGMDRFVALIHELCRRLGDEVD